MNLYFYFLSLISFLFLPNKLFDMDMFNLNTMYVEHSILLYWVVILLYSQEKIKMILFSREPCFDFFYLYREY